MRFSGHSPEDVPRWVVMRRKRVPEVGISRATLRRRGPLPPGRVDRHAVAIQLRGRDQRQRGNSCLGGRVVALSDTALQPGGRDGAITVTSTTLEPSIVDYPPVNAIPSRGWFELADTITKAGDDPGTHVVILRVEGRGFNAGVDIKEMQRSEGFTALIDANRSCFAAFRAVYDCAVPVVVAVNGFCMGAGIGLVGNADIVASDDTTFGLMRSNAAPLERRPTCPGWCPST
jgi:Enoyl-CoA hydratase/isomerase